MSHALEKVRVRNALEPRREPYWGAPIATGRYVGLRKISPTAASWIARARLEDEGGNVRHTYKSLGVLSPEFDYDEAKASAVKWFKTLSVVKSDVVTVADACRAYVEDRRKKKGDAAANDAAVRFERTIYGREKSSRKSAIAANAIARVPLKELRSERVTQWFDGLALRAAAANRTLTALKAALNLAVKNRQAPDELGMDLRARVEPHKGAKNRRKLYLNLKQRRALLKAARGAVRDLIEAAILTGARAGELVNATAEQFDAPNMTFIGKTGTRTVRLSPAAVKLYTRLAKGKAPADRLLTRDDGKPWAHSDWDELVREAARKAKLPTERRTGVCLYVLRHSFITEAVTKEGVSILDVSLYVGTSLRMVGEFYGQNSGDDRLAKVTML